MVAERFREPESNSSKLSFEDPDSNLAHGNFNDGTIMEILVVIIPGYMSYDHS